MTATALKIENSWGTNYLLPSLSTRKLESITPQNWQDIINYMASTGKAASTCRAMICVIGRFNAWCERNRYHSNDASLLSVPRTARESKDKIALQPDDIRKVFSIDTTLHYGKTIPEFYIHAFRFCIITGLRRGELVGLEWSDYDGERITIQRSVAGNRAVTRGKNSNARRTIYIPELAKRELEAQREMLNKLHMVPKNVFPGLKGDTANPELIVNHWESFCKANDIQLTTFHEIRHTAISMYKGDIPKELLKDMVGHSESMDTFGVYGHEFGEKQKQTADAMNSVLESVLVG